MSLDASFKAARMASSPFFLYARRSNPASFFLCSSSEDARIFNELIHFLNNQGLQSIAVEFCDAMGGMTLLEDFKSLRKEDFNETDLNFLKPWQKRKILRLAAGSTALAISSRDDYGSDSAHSEASTENSVDGGSEAEDEPTHTVVAIKHPGDPEDFQGHMSGFIHDFLDYMTEDSAADPEWETYDINIGG